MDAVVQTFFSSIENQAAVDQEIVDYVCSIVEDPDPETSVDVLVSVVSAALPSFADQSSERQVQLVLQLLDNAEASSSGAVSSTEPGVKGSSSVEAVVAALRQAKLEHEQLPSACVDITNTKAASSFNDSSSTSTGKQGPNIAPLLELCSPSVSSAFLHYSLEQQFLGNVQAAANWLLETAPAEVLQQQQAWEQDLKQREQQQQESERQKKLQKKLIVDKFDLRVVSAHGGAGSKATQRHVPDLLQLPRKVLPQDSKLRYRDGRVVSTKGEKVIIEKVGEEWDGGSRGKVYTKGKRGKGFH